MDVSGRRKFIDDKVTVVRIKMGSNPRKEKNVTFVLSTD
jgi:hypothetical protein